jgi:hypothetical protein
MEKRKWIYLGVAAGILAIAAAFIFGTEQGHEMLENALNNPVDEGDGTPPDVGGRYPSPVDHMPVIHPDAQPRDQGPA